MKSTRHTPFGRRFRTSTALRSEVIASRRCVACLAAPCDSECGRCSDCYRERREQVLRLQALIHVDPTLSAADLMHRTGASAPVVTALLRGGVDAALLARESLRACEGSPMHVRELVHAHHERDAAASAGNRFAVR